MDEPEDYGRPLVDKAWGDDRLPPLDESLSRSWIMPTNVPLRTYQHAIVCASLTKNTLCCLPTGLGKTFIAAVVMYNFRRWFPEGLVLFLAPTKPLVAQQIDACRSLVGLAHEDSAELTGKMPKEVRPLRGSIFTFVFAHLYALA